MDRKEIEKKLRDKLEANYQMYIRQLQNKPSADLIEQAAEIAAAKLVYEELKGGGYNTDYLEYLLRFENPLEVVRNAWLDESNVAHSQEMDHALWSLIDKGNAEQDYALDETFLPPEQGVRLC